MASTDSSTRDRPTFRAGFSGFEVYDRWVNRAGYAGGVPVWVLTYWLGTRWLQGPASEVLVWATMTAMTVTSVYFAVLYTYAVGAPLGNLFAPGVITFGVPGPVYRALTAPEVREATEVVPYALYDGFALPAGVVGIVLPFLLVVVVYWIRRDVEEWEQRVMPDSFSLPEWYLAGSERPIFTDAELARHYSRALGIFISLALIAAVVVALRLPPEGLIKGTGDISGLVLALTFLLSIRYA